jgi:hypothetical protein
MSSLKSCALVVLVTGMMAPWAQAASVSSGWSWISWISEAGVKQGITSWTGGLGSSSGGQGWISAAPEAISSSNPSPNAPGTSPDAYLNFGTSSYPEQSTLTVGTAQPWFDSPAVTSAFGHTPNTQEQQSFINSVVTDVQHTFTASGLTGSNAVSLTIDPSAGALHTLSVVSGLSYAPNPNAIGITDVGANGFGFIDKLNYATTPDQLEWAVAHNITHELMHAFGVAVHHDQTGDYLDAATAQWSLLTNPSATLSPAAVADIVAHNVGRSGSPYAGVGGEMIDGDQEVLASVPEPSTIAIWALAASVVLLKAQASRRASGCVSAQSRHAARAQGVAPAA